MLKFRKYQTASRLYLEHSKTFCLTELYSSEKFSANNLIYFIGFKWKLRFDLFGFAFIKLAHNMRYWKCNEHVLLISWLILVSHKCGKSWCTCAHVHQIYAHRESLMSKYSHRIFITSHIMWNVRVMHRESKKTRGLLDVISIEKKSKRIGNN